MTRTMLDKENRVGEELLALRSQISDLGLVPPWIERLAAEHAIPSSTQFSMNLCLEEILSNIIRHGYANQPDRPILIRYSPLPDGCFLLVIEDEAPQFDPIAVEELPVEATLEGERIGGLGLRLVRGFAKSVEYEPTPVGNRLRISFASAH